MAETLSATLTARLHWLAKSTPDLTTITDTSQVEIGTAIQQFAYGTGSGQVDQLWYDTRTIATGANDDLDLTNLTRLIFGGSITTVFAKVRGLLLINKSATTGNDLKVGGAGTNEWAGAAAPFLAAGDIVRAPASSPLLLGNRLTGWTVDATHKILRINNPAATSVEYDIAIFGTSV